MSIYSALRKGWQRNRTSVLVHVTAIYTGIQIVLQSRILREARGTQGLSNSKAVHYPRIPRLINDVTIEWDETMHRPWLSLLNQTNQGTYDSTIRPPPFMILLTDWGWNHPNQTHALTHIRSLRERELLSGIVNHPYFHPKGWEDIRNGILPISATVNYYVFADVLQCPESNYPNYGSPYENFDGFQNRSIPQGGFKKCMRNPETFDFLEHPLFQNTTTLSAAGVADRAKNDKSATATLVTLNCRGWRPACPKFDNDHISVAAIGGSFDDMVLYRDQGLMPPAPKPVRLSKAEEAAIASCNDEADRPLNVVYVGNFRSGKNTPFHNQHGGARSSYKDFHNASEGIVILHKDHLDNLGSIISTSNQTMLETPSYQSLLRSTKFALVPRGDNKFSYRFTEALSAGAIPVFHGDNHVLPFRPELVDWNKCGLVLPEKDAGATAMKLIQDLIRQPNATSKLCSMRQYCYFEIYQKFVATPTKEINGLVEGLEALARGERKEHVGLVCNQTSVANLDCNTI